jgi:hypothetical protein
MTLAALAVVACSSAGDMMSEIMDSGVPDAGAQDTPAECNKREMVPGSDGNFWRWAEFEIEPGQTEATVCTLRNSWPFDGQTHCTRYKPQWIQGTNTAIVLCGFEYPDRIDNEVVSITVHN